MRVNNVPVFILSHELFHLVLSPCPAEEANERVAGWTFDSQPRSTHHIPPPAPVFFLVELSVLWRVSHLGRAPGNTLLGRSTHRPLRNSL